MFLEQHSPTDVIFEYYDSFHYINRLLNVAYLCYMFNFLNKLNLTLHVATVFEIEEKI